MNTEQTYPKVEPEPRDSMPPEVAIEFLCNPRNKLSARFRKNCQAARDRVFVSQHPIRMALDAENPEHIVLIKGRPPAYLDVGFPHKEARRKDCFRVYDTMQAPKSVEDRLNAKLRSATWAKLHQIQTRCDRRGERVFNALQKVNANTTAPEAFKQRAIAALELQAAKFDLIHGLTTAEINRRGSLCNKTA
jgi:hypothetical protein